MELKDRLTNEALSKKFKNQNQFEFVNFAIRLAENMIKTGREPSVVDMQNRAMQVLSEIESGKNTLTEIPESVETQTTEITMLRVQSEKGTTEKQDKFEEKDRKRKKILSDNGSKTGTKRNRKILADD